MLVEALFAVALISLSTVAIASGLTFCAQQLWITRDNAIATQVLVDKTELIRYRGWNRLDLLPYHFQENWSGTVFDGVITAEPVSFSNSYSDKVRLVRVTINWKTGALPRTRTWETFVAESGYGNLWDFEQ